MKIKCLSSDQMLHEARDLYTRWLDLPSQEKRGVVESITEKITISNDEVVITLAYLPSSSELVAKEQQNQPEVTQ